MDCVSLLLLCRRHRRESRTIRPVNPMWLCWLLLVFVFSTHNHHLTPTPIRRRSATLKSNWAARIRKIPNRYRPTMEVSVFLALFSFFFFFFYTFSTQSVDFLYSRSLNLLFSTRDSFIALSLITQSDLNWQSMGVCVSLSLSMCALSQSRNTR